jgi:predicted kinase
VSEPAVRSGVRMLLQLSGVPGTGKSTLARGLAAGLDLVVLDTDVVKSALLSTDVPFAVAGRATYAAVLALAGDLLAQGRSAVIDSPCRYVDLLAAGHRVAADAGVAYRLVELWADDPAALLPRLTARDHRQSQVTPAVPEWELGTPVDTLHGWQEQLVRPQTGWLRLDALLPPEEVLRSTLDYLGAVAPARSHHTHSSPGPGTRDVSTHSERSQSG